MSEQEDRIDKLSKEIFNKPAKDIKYVLVTNYIHEALLKEELARTGLYQWQNVFNGYVRFPRDIKDYNDYDIVQVNLSAQDVPLIGDIRDAIGKNSKTKLIVNNDYTTEVWGTSFRGPTTLAREIRPADMIFGTEYYQVTALSELTGRKCYIIPHPCDVKRLKLLEPVKQKNYLTTIWRRYDNFTYIPHLVVRNHNLITQLIGYDKKVDRSTWLTTTLFDYVLQGTNCFDFWKQMRESKIIYDPFTFHSYNRSIVECAAFGIPVVGSNRTQSINICYPFTKVDPFDVLSARKLIDKLLTDKEFYKKVVEYAKNASEYYNHLNSQEKYLMALKESLVEKEAKNEKDKGKNKIKIKDK